MIDRLRICFLSFYFAPMVGGAETQSERQARQLQELGHDVIVVTLRANRRWQRAEILEGLPIVRVGGAYTRRGQLRVGRLGYLPCTLAMLCALWRLREQYDVIHVFQVSPLAGAAVFIGKITRKPVMISIQSAGPGEQECRKLEHGGMLMADTLTEADYLAVDVKDVVTGDITYMPRAVIGGRVILNYLRSSGACYHVNSARNYDYVASHGFPKECIARIPHGVDTQKFQPATEQPAQRAGSERTITCVARLDFAKGIDVLLHAWKRLFDFPGAWRVDLQVRLQVIGEGKLRPQLERLAADLGIEESVEFLGLRKDIPEILQRSWGFVCPSRWESLPNALLEAMACGLPCVATRVSGSEDLITDGINGLLVEPNQPAEMAVGLRRVLEDGELAQALGKMALQTIIPDYQLTTVVKQLEELYRELSARSKGKARSDELQRATGLVHVEQERSNA